MNKKQRKEIEQTFLDATESCYRKRQRTLLKVMSDKELLDRYADAKQLAIVYRDNPQIRHLPPHEAMQLKTHKMEIYKKDENGKAELVESKYVVEFPMENNVCHTPETEAAITE